MANFLEGTLWQNQRVLTGAKTRDPRFRAQSQGYPVRAFQVQRSNQNGSIWRLAEVRSHASPRLREAFEWVIDQLEQLEDRGGSSLLDIMASTNPIRKGGEPLSDDIEFRPHILHLMALFLSDELPGSWWDGSSGPARKVLILDNSLLLGGRIDGHNSKSPTRPKDLGQSPRHSVPSLFIRTSPPFAM